jgi:NAD(P)-dependent dehydrogenase (short-subunit alcohol dehydrogenase family)
MNATGTLAGITAVVTGGGRGIGRAIALRLAAQGAELALWARSADQLAAVVTEIAAAGGRARAYVVDVADPAAVAVAAAAVRAGQPPVRVVVNNAGAVARGPTATMDDADWRRVLAVNLDGTFFVTRAFLSDLTADNAHRGRIINLASIAGRQGTPLLAAYCAAKHGVVGFTRALAEEHDAAKVSVNAICPGSVDTAMLREGLPGAEPEMTTDEIAAVAEFLATSAPPGMTGSCLDVFG